MKIISLESLYLSPFFKTKYVYNADIHPLPFNSPIFSVIIVCKKNGLEVYLIFACILSLFQVIIFYWKLILTKRDFKFPLLKNSFLFKTIERDFPVHLLSADIIFSFTSYHSYYRRHAVERRFYYEVNKQKERVKWMKFFSFVNLQ